ncbi:MAG: hypothetical protein HA496_00590 [Thaumarchaeota archaeon]|jgi:phage terminase small subunit|nr:hypothetical protein [Nitrososphaerota archaeon]
MTWRPALSITKNIRNIVRRIGLGLGCGSSARPKTYIIVRKKESEDGRVFASEDYCLQGRGS